MKREKTTRNAVISSLLALVLCFAMLVGTSFAWFTDSVSTGVNPVVAGNLSIGMQYLDGDTWTDAQGAIGLLGSDLWEPGHTEIIYLNISNMGTLALDYALQVEGTNEVTSTDSQGNEVKLSDILRYKLIALEGVPDQTTFDRETALAAPGTDKQLLEPLDIENRLEPATSEYAALVIYWPETAGGNYAPGQSKPEIELVISVVAKQTSAESGQP